MDILATIEMIEIIKAQQKLYKKEIVLMQANADSNWTKLALKYNALASLRHKLAFDAHLCGPFARCISGPFRR